jgi:hypothetical protein
VTGLSIEDRGFRRRFVIALAAAVAVHEIVAGVWPARPAPPPEATVATQTIALVRRTPPPTPAPTPVPTPRQTPRATPPPRATLAPRVVVFHPAPKAAATPQRTVGGAAAHLHVVKVTPVRTHVTARVALAAGTHAGVSNGGTGTGAGAGNGTGGLGGRGTGTGGNGTGNGGTTNTAPCADVYILPGHLSFKPDGTVVQEVLAKVVYRDGTVDVGRFPWPFLYAAEKLNPLVHDDALVGPHHGVPVQQPPAGTDVSSLPSAVQFVLAHTDPTTGFSTVDPCSTAASDGTN